MIPATEDSQDSIISNSETSRKRKLSTDSDIRPEKLPNVSDKNPGDDCEKPDTKYKCLIVSNLPANWDYNAIRAYFTKKFVFENLDIINKQSHGCTVKLLLTSTAQLQTAKEELQNCEIDGQKILCEVKPVRIENKNTEDVLPKCETESQASEDMDMSKIMELESYDIDPSGLFGLKPSYLASLGIKPPIDNWVHVSNFRCDNSQLRNVMELAGRVVIFSCYILQKYAKIMYSHPLEAVQAVSMLNGQIFYGDKLKIIMIPNPGDMIILPKGLSAIGSGLGNKGTPLKEIEKHFNNFLSGKPTALNTQNFRKVNENHKFDRLDVETVNAPITTRKSSIPETISEEVKSEQTETLDELKPDKNEGEENNDSLTDNAGTKERETYKYNNSSDSENSVSGPEDDHKSQHSNDKDDTRSRSNSSSQSTTNKNISSNIDVIKPIETIRVRNNLQAPKKVLNKAPQWTPNIPITPTGPVFAGQGTVGPRFGMGPMQNAMIGQIRPIRPIGPIGPVGTIRHMGPGLIGQSGPMGHPGQSGLIGIPGPMGQPGPMGPAQMRPSAPIMQPGHIGSRPQGPVFQTANLGQQRLMNFPGPVNQLSQSNPLRQPGPVRPVGPPGPIGPPNPMNQPNNVVSGKMPAGEDSEPVMLEFKNLPLSTTMPFLCQRLSESGQVVSLQFTTPGCALVRFANMAQATGCFRRFNGANAEGNILDVRFV